MANSRDIDWPTRLAEAQTVVQTHLDRTPCRSGVGAPAFDPDVPEAGVAAADRVVQGAWGAGRRGHGGARRTPGGDGLGRKPRPRYRIRRDAPECSGHGGRPRERLERQGRSVAPLRHRSAARRGRLRGRGGGCAEPGTSHRRHLRLCVHPSGRHRRPGHHGRRGGRPDRRTVPHRRAGRRRRARSRHCDRRAWTGHGRRRRGTSFPRRVCGHARRPYRRRGRRFHCRGRPGREYRVRRGHAGHPEPTRRPDDRCRRTRHPCGGTQNWR